MDALKNMSKTSRSNLVTYALVIVAFLVMQGLSAAGALSSSMKGQLIPITTYISLAISLNLVVGISGELSLGHAGFMSVGAFTGVVVASMLQGVVGAPVARFALSCVAGGLAAALAGFLVGVPVMRLQGDYLAIVTLAFGEIIKNLLNNLWLGLDDNGLHVSMRNAQALGLGEGGRLLINGPQGAAGIERLSTFTLGFILVLFTLFVVFNLTDSRSGRAIMAVRDNRIAAESVGISTTKYRLMAFVVSAALAGMAGCLYAMNFNSIVPSKFDFNNSINILVFVVLGGMGNIRGGIISATLLTVLPEKLRFLGNFRMLIYAVVLILVMLVSNNRQLRMALDGVVGKLRRRSLDDDDLPSGAKGGDA